MTDNKKITDDVEEIERLIRLLEQRILYESRWDTWQAGGWELEGTKNFMTELPQDEIK